MKIHLVYEGNYVGSVKNKKELYIVVRELTGMTTKEIVKDNAQQCGNLFRQNYLHECGYDIYRMGRLWFSYLESDFIPSTHIKKHRL